MFTHGLIHVLGQAGILGRPADPAPGRLPGHALAVVDVSVVDPRVLGIERTIGLITELIGHHPVVALVDDSLSAWGPAWLGAGAAAVLSRYAEPETLIRAIRSAASRLRPGPAEPEAPEPPALSGRESEVLHLIADGCTHHQVAHRLGISAHTVDTYMKRIRTKLGAATKAELIRLAVRDGLLSA